MDVQAGYDQVVMMMLLVDEPGGQFAGVMVIDQGDDGNLFATCLAGLVADQAVADQIANRFASRGVALAVDVPVKRLQQGILQGNADACQIRHGWSRRSRNGLQSTPSTFI